MSAPDVEIVRAEVRKQAPALYGQLAGFDAMVMPTVAILPPTLESIEQDPEAYRIANMLALRNTTLGNILPCCAEPFLYRGQSHVALW